MLGHSKEIITVDTYGDNSNMLPDEIPELLEFIEEVRPQSKVDELMYNDISHIEINTDYLK